MVTLEDVVEELVGDVADEHDRRRASTARVGDGSWLLPGVLRPDELAEVTGLRVPADGPYETLGGLLMSELGRIPSVGDEIVVDAACSCRSRPWRAAGSSGCACARSRPDDEDES